MKVIDDCFFFPKFDGISRPTASSLFMIAKNVIAINFDR